MRTSESLSGGRSCKVDKRFERHAAVMQLQRTDVVAQVPGTTQRGRRSRRQMAHLLIRIMKYSKDIHFQL